MQNEIKCQQQLISQYEGRILGLQEELAKINDLFSDTQQELQERCVELEETHTSLRNTNRVLRETKQNLKATVMERDENQFLIDEYNKNENALHSQASSLLNVVEDSLTHVDRLHSKLDRKRHVEANNVNAQDLFGDDCRQLIQTVHQSLQQFQGENAMFFDAMKVTVGEWAPF